MPHAREGACSTGGHDFGKLAFTVEEPELEFDDPAELLLGAREGCDLLREEREQLLDAVLEKRKQQLIFRVEVQVDGAVGDPGRLRDLAYAGFVEALACEHLDCGAQNALAFVASALEPARFRIVNRANGLLFCCSGLAE